MEESSLVGHVDREYVDSGTRVTFSTDCEEAHDVFGLDTLRDDSLALATESQHEHEDGPTSYDEDDYRHYAWGNEVPQTQVISPVCQEQREDQELTAEHECVQEDPSMEEVDPFEGPKFPKTPMLAAAKRSATWLRDRQEFEEEHDWTVPDQEPATPTATERELERAQVERLVAERVAKINRDIEEQERLRRMGLSTPERKSKDPSDISSLTPQSRGAEEQADGNPQSFYYGSPEKTAELRRERWASLTSCPSFPSQFCCLLR